MDVLYYCSLGHHYWSGYEEGVPEGAIIRRDCQKHEAKWPPPGGEIVTSMDDPGFVGDLCDGMGL